MVDDKVTLFWKQRKCRLTMPLGRANNGLTLSTCEDGKLQISDLLVVVPVDKAHVLESTVH
jgi:hypothetical protein